MRKTKNLTIFTILFCLLLQTIPAAYAQTAPAADINERIRKEGMENSQIMRTIHYFTDVYGPRLTGSPNLKAAGEWAIKQMTSWGMENGQLEPWEFGHPGWVNERAAGFITAPVQDSLVFEVLAWTPATNGAVRGEAFQMEIPTVASKEIPGFMMPPTQEELTNYFNSIKDRVRGKMVLMGKPNVLPVDFEPPSKRISDEDLKRRMNPSAAPRQAPTPRPRPAPRAGELNFLQIGEQIDKFLLENGVLVRINDAGRQHGQIRAFNNRTFDTTKVVPTVVMRNEDYGRIWRLLDSKMNVSLEFDIRNKVIPEGTISYNTVAEIPGSDKKDEVIMLGGHLDSWHAATGATDNAVGCAIMMEAARILKTIGVKPRRTIRVALWAGEEQGLLGSQAYVKKHFGSFETPTAGYEKFGGYFNIDSGTGKARGLSVFGPPEASAILNEAVKPFEEYGIVGAMNTQSRGLGGSDHTSFNQAGLPGIGVLQDPIEYGSHTWHTNLDTYERIVEDDVKKSAVIVAAAVYQLAMRDGLLPRYKTDAMPKLPVRQN